MAISGLSRVRTELLELTVIPTLTPHPVQMYRQLSSHRYFGDLPAAPRGEVKELAAPLRLTAHRDLGRFHQQEAQQRVALFADVPESAAIAALVTAIRANLRGGAAICAVALCCELLLILRWSLRRTSE